MNSRTGFRLLTLLVAAEVTLAGAGLLASLVLINSTTRLQYLASRIGSAVESVYATDQAERALLVHDRESDLYASTRRPEHLYARNAAQLDLEEWLQKLSDFADTPRENELIRRARESAGIYLKERKRVEASGRSADAVATQIAGSVNAAQAALETLVQLNYQQSHALQEQALAEDARATMVGWGAATGVIFALGSVVFLLHREFHRPVVRLRDRMAKLEAGRLAVIPVDGPTELREIALAFNHLVERLTRQRELQIRFLAGIAHDLRTPLNAVKLSVELLRDENLSTEGKETLEAVNRQISQLDRQVGDLLDTTRIESGQLSLQFGNHDLALLAENASRVFRGVSPRHTVRVITPDQPVPCRCDATRVGQVINNLLSNAIKYSPSGGEVVVRLETRDSDATISVTDEGIGISTADLAHIFEPFRRTAVTRETIPGVGLGLSVARRIAEAHGGSIEVRSAPMMGSTFVLRLPLQLAQSEVQAHAQES